MFKKAFVGLSAAMFSATGFSSAAMAAPVQGQFAAQSEGSLLVSARVPARVSIRGLEDVELLDVEPGVAANKWQNVCVYSNNAGGAYNITATGTADGFVITDGTDNIAYTVAFNDAPAQTSGTALTSGVVETGLASTANNVACGGMANESASLGISIAPSELQKMAAGVTYSGTLTLLVAPN
ncbi:hypothetical protein [Sphingomicrobium astaxanthinifaciens]|nr:hypothetical protein [Sphingomicrobium astaxanthinifaciens]MCJ7420396.1 hypothetical protein [Sphingomicrobium astaxanthinifaciens]